MFYAKKKVEPQRGGIRLGNSVLWASSASVLAKAIDLASLFLLARLLDPESFGLVAMALLVINALELLMDFGLGQALVQRGNMDNNAAETTLYIVPATGIVLFAVAFFLAGPTAAFFRSPELTNIIRALSLVLVVQSIGAVPGAILERRLLYRRMTIAESLSSLCYLTVAASLAYAGWGVWSLVYGKLARSFVKSAIMWTVAGWKPAGRFNLVAAKELYRFGRHIVVLGIISFALKNLDNAIIGRYLDPVQLGLYSVAYAIGNLLPTFVKMTLGRVTFPYYSRMRENPDELREKFLTINKANVVLCVWLTLMLAGAFPSVAGSILGDQWKEIGPLIQILAFFGLQRSIGSVCAPALNALGVPQAQREPMLLNAAIFVPLAIPAAKVGGAPAMALLVTVSIVPGFIWTLRRTFALLEIDSELPRLLVPCAIGVACIALQKLVGQPFGLEDYRYGIFAAASLSVSFLVLIRLFEPKSFSTLGAFGRMLLETT